MIAPGIYSLDQPPLVGATGQGIRVAIVDSGVVPSHPHVGDVAGGIHFTPSGTTADYMDRIGHGTAVAGAIREKAPDATLIAVRVFDRTLATTAEQLAEAIEWAAREGVDLINVSLGTPNEQHRARLALAVDHAVAAGAWVVSAETREGQPMLPGSLATTIGVQADAGVARDAIVVEAANDGRLRLRASPYPRPIPGVPVSANLQGVSFAVANASGFLARWRQTLPR
ncbi:MAG: S8 family serine peptidase [Gemmatimonadaceae bacterium]